MTRAAEITHTKYKPTGWETWEQSDIRRLERGTDQFGQDIYRIELKGHYLNPRATVARRTATKLVRDLTTLLKGGGLKDRGKTPKRKVTVFEADSVRRFDRDEYTWYGFTKDGKTVLLVKIK